MTVAKGPGMDRPPFRSDAELDVSFRMLMAYDCTTDGILTRFDVLLNSERSEKGSPNSGEQFNAVFHSSGPGAGNLLEPSNGVIRAVGLKANRQDLIDALRGLADAIEANPPKDRHWKVSRQGLRPEDSVSGVPHNDSGWMK